MESSRVPPVVSSAPEQRSAVNDLGRGRLRREWRTVEAMIDLYCRRMHDGEGGRPCAGCRELREYARERLRRCPFGAEKPTCAHCRVHCYRAAPRERVREVMRVAGPRMLARHPYLALMHLWVDGRRPAPEHPRRAARALATGEIDAPPS
jgi:hypothetical protein